MPKVLDYTVSKEQGSDEWSSLVTFNFEFDEKEYTLKEKRELAAFLVDLSVEDFKNMFTYYGYTYDEIAATCGGEEIFLDRSITIMKHFVSYKDIDKLEALGVDVVSVKTPYGTTLYTSSLNNTPIKCAFIENGTYDFTIKNGTKKETKSVKIDNVRDYDSQTPHQVKIDFITRNGHTASYAVDGSTSFTQITDGMVFSANNKIEFDKESEFHYVVKDENFYKYFATDEEWDRWYVNESAYVFIWFLWAAQDTLPEEVYKQVTARQLIYIYVMETIMSNGSLNGFDVEELNVLSGEWVDYIDMAVHARANGETVSSEEVSQKFPKALLGNSASYTAECILNINSDTNLLILVKQCFTVDTYVEVVVWDEEKKKKIRIRKKVKDLTYDDELLVWDFDKGEFTTAKPLWIMKPQVATSYNLLKFSDGSELKTINQHRIFNKEAGKFTYPMTDETPIGTTTFNAEGKEVQLVSKEVITVKEVEYMNVITNYHMNVFAGNILTSCRLSNIYDIKDMKYVKDDRELATKEEYANIPEEYFNGLRIAEQPKEINRGNDVQFDNSLEEYVQRLIKMKL